MLLAAKEGQSEVIVQEVPVIGSCNGLEMVGGRSEVVALAAPLKPQKPRMQFSERLHPLSTKKVVDRERFGFSKYLTHNFITMKYTNDSK